MDIRTLHYVVTIDQLGSYSKAAKFFFTSQSTISRAVNALEEEVGFQIFRRTNQGVVVTDNGKVFINRIRPFLKEIEQMSRKQYGSGSDNNLMVVTQRSAINSLIFAAYANMREKEMETANLVFAERPTETILSLVSDGTFEIGIVHYTSAQEDKLLEKCDALGIDHTIIENSRICAQVHAGHPLADRSCVSLEDLADYPRITYVNEDVADFNYCSDMLAFNPAIQKKRIMIDDRGALRDMIEHTDGYYLGCECSKFEIVDELNRVYLPLTGVDYTLKTVWLKRKHRHLSAMGEEFTRMLADYYRKAGALEPVDPE